YMVDRLGPLPGWTLGYGFDLDEWTNPNELRERKEFIDSQAAYDLMVGGRSEGPNSGTDHRADSAWHSSQDFADYEHHRPDYEVYVAAYEASDGSPVQSGDRFRVRDEGRSKDYTEEETVDGLWTGTMAGGVSAIWGNLLDESRGIDNYGSNNGSLPYSDQTEAEIATWNAFFVDADRFHLDTERANRFTDRADQFALYSEDENQLVVYAEDTRSIELDLAELANDSGWTNGARVTAVDTEEAYVELDLGVFEFKNDIVVDLGSSSDWALSVTPA
ncbi:MAG: hypothetical protein AAFR52_09945, partial [Pseudomonadota bacterium]